MNRLPVLLVSWGSGQNALLSYLSPALYRAARPHGLGAAPPMALSGCLTLWLFYKTALRARGGRFALAALLFLALCPLARNGRALGPGVEPPARDAHGRRILRGAQRGAAAWALAGAGAFFGLALYAYGTAFFVLPPLLLFCVWRLRKSLRPLPFLAGLGIFLALALPIALCQLRNMLGLPAAEFLGFTLPELTATRQSATSVFGTGLAGLWGQREFPRAAPHNAVGRPRLEQRGDRRALLYLRPPSRSLGPRPLAEDEGSAARRRA